MVWEKLEQKPIPMGQMHFVQLLAKLFLVDDRKVISIFSLYCFRSCVNECNICRSHYSVRIIRNNLGDFFNNSVKKTLLQKDEVYQVKACHNRKILLPDHHHYSRRPLAAPSNRKEYIRRDMSHCLGLCR